MVSDVPLGAFLSGGLDSSAVVAFMARNSATPVRTFSIGFEESGYDETGYADLVAKRYGTDNTRLIVTPEYKDVIESILLNFDEPFGDSSALPTYLVSFLTRQYVTVALSGDGGDELFGGYITYGMLLRFAQLMGFVPSALIPLASKVADILPAGSKLERRLRFVGMSENDRFVRVVSHFRPTDKAELYSPETNAHVANGLVSLRRKAELLEQEGVSHSDRMQFADFMQYLPDDILVKVDRVSMFVSLEARAPFLDHRLVEFAFSLPAAWKVSPSRSKIILREALKAMLPAPILDRGKWGFSVPVREWLAGPLYEFCRARIMGGSMDQFFAMGVVDRMLQEHRTRKRDHSSRLWLLLCFALWASRYGKGA
jgi:asparagine synthase (glutamine-hydrolysing)